MCLAVPGKIISIEGESFERVGRIEFGQIVKEAFLALVPEAEKGNYILVHAGVGIKIINEEEAMKTFEYLDEIGEIEEQFKS
ncbi:MAG: HypC/HybG/HupF family hydrogenase formation chaperone [Alphaproteobacteria bacterium]|nr:HypC/HybG/HupF family hydrogenase formation chaperone [Alphaproteobacteria bacterium]